MITGITVNVSPAPYIFIYNLVVLTVMAVFFCHLFFGDHRISVRALLGGWLFLAAFNACRFVMLMLGAICGF